MELSLIETENRYIDSVQCSQSLLQNVPVMPFFSHVFEGW